jgi:hypothetical protein
MFVPKMRGDKRGVRLVTTNQPGQYDLRKTPFSPSTVRPAHHNLLSAQSTLVIQLIQEPDVIRKQERYGRLIGAHLIRDADAIAF